jgi:hypothetical protein
MSGCQGSLGFVPAGDRKPEEEFFNYYEANKMDRIYNTHFTIICAQTWIHKYFSFSFFFQTEKWFLNCGTSVTGLALKLQSGKKNSNNNFGRGKE